MNLEPIVSEEIKKLQLPQEVEIDIRLDSDTSPLDSSKQDNESYFIQISIGSDEDDSTRDSTCSYLDFWYNQNTNSLEHVNFSLKEDLRGKGFGRKLVESMEEIGRKLGCNRTKINLNLNPSFWAHLDYQDQGDYWEKHL